MSKDIRALLHKYVDLAKRELENQSLSKKEQKATVKELAEYKQTINKLKKYKEEKRIASLEDLQHITHLISKMNKEQKSAVEEMPAMPPGPMPTTSEQIENTSWELSEAKKKFDEKTLAYYELVGIYFVGKKVDSKELWSLYDDSMNLYNKYIELSNKESDSSKD